MWFISYSTVYTFLQDSLFAKHVYVLFQGIGVGCIFVHLWCLFTLFVVRRKKYAESKKEKVPSLILYFHQIGLLLEKESQLEHPVLKIGDDDYILLLDLFLDKKRYLSMR